MKKFILVACLLALTACDKKPKEQPKSEETKPAAATLKAASPPGITNALDYPVAIYGSNLPKDATVRLDITEAKDLNTTWVNEGLLTTTIPANTIEFKGNITLKPFNLEVTSGGKSLGKVSIDVINDLFYPLASDLEVHPDGHTVYAITPTTDRLWILEKGKASRSIPVGDEPNAVRLWTHEDKHYLVISHTYDDVWVLPIDTLESPRKITAPRHARDIDVSGNTLLISERVNDHVHQFDLVTGEAKGKVLAGVNPREVVVVEGKAFAGNLGSGDLSILDFEGGKETRIAAAPGAKILGGHTAKYAEFVMGHTGVRDLVYAPDLGVVFSADLGPNLGPNPDKVEVTQNGGVGVFDAKTGEYLHHYSMFSGAPEQMVYDEANKRLFVTDLSRGRLVVFDAKKVAKGEPKAMVSLGELTPPPRTEFMRPEADFNVQGRASVSLHSGPVAVRLDKDGNIYVLNRFTSTVYQFANPKKLDKRLEQTHIWHGLPKSPQRARHMGEIVYKTDLGNTRMSCDTCHYDGHNQGLLFTKGEPMHIYRVPTIRAINYSAPYFTPALFPSLEFISGFVASRNRFDNPKTTSKEVGALAMYQRGLVTPPNPYLTSDYPKTVEMPDGTKGDPGKGSLAFDQRCASCHTPGAFTSDQYKETRAQTHDVGTHVTLPLRLEMQDSADYKVPPPALVGVWDNYPLYHSGGAGFEIQENGQVLGLERHAMRKVLSDAQKSGKHGDLKGLSDQDINDLLAFLHTL